MDFKKRVIKEMDMTVIQAETLYKGYIETCEKLAKEYHAEQCNIDSVSNSANIEGKEYFENINKFHKVLNNEIGENIKPFMPQTIKIISKFRDIFLNSANKCDCIMPFVDLENNKCKECRKDYC